jgi:hypothetical protein
MTIKRWNDFDQYKIDWKGNLPNTLKVYDWKKVIEYKIGNIMLNPNMVQVVYSSDEWGVPGDLEFDIYFDDTKVLIDLTMGNLVEYSFSITRPNKVHIISSSTSKGSKFRKDESDFGLDIRSIGDLVKSFNKINGVQLKDSDLDFLKSEKL